MKKTLFAILVCLGISTPAIADKNLSFDNVIVGTGLIYTVIDGDTVWVNVDDRGVFAKFTQAAKDSDSVYQNKKESALKTRYRSVKMRLGGINTAESVHRNTSLNSKEGKSASDFLKSKASKRQAKFACWDHGLYGRPICSVEFQDMDNSYVDIGYLMISEGHSNYVTKYGKHPYADADYRRANQR